MSNVFLQYFFNSDFLLRRNKLDQNRSRWTSRSLVLNTPFWNSPKRREKRIRKQKRRKETRKLDGDWRNYNFTGDYYCENIQQFCQVGRNRSHRRFPEIYFKLDVLCGRRNCNAACRGVLHRRNFAIRSSAPIIGPRWLRLIICQPYCPDFTLMTNNNPLSQINLFRTEG